MSPLVMIGPTGAILALAVYEMSFSILCSLPQRFREPVDQVLEMFTSGKTEVSGFQDGLDDYGTCSAF